MSIKQAIDAVREENVTKFTAVVEEGSETEIRQDLLESKWKVVRSIDTNEGVELTIMEQ
jgi:hypothetical protein